MSFVPCCKCGNISIIAPLHRVLKTFVKRTSAQTQKRSMNISQISSSPFLTHQVYFPDKNDDITSNISADFNYSDDSNQNQIHPDHEYINITESPVLALAIPQNSIFLREIDQVRFANDQNQFPEINNHIALTGELHEHSNLHFHQEDGDHSHKESDNLQNFTVSIVVKSVFMKCSKCGAIFVINFTRRNAYLCRLASGNVKILQNKDSIPIGEDNSNSYDSQNSNSRLPPRAIIRSFASSPFLAQRQALKNKTAAIKNRQMISNFVPVFVMPFICGCGNISESGALKPDHSHPCGSPGSAPTIDPKLCEKRIKRSNSLGSQKPWTKISNDNNSNPNDTTSNNNDVNNADNVDLFNKTNESNGLIRNRHYGSDGDIFGVEWPDTDFEFMFSAKEEIPFEFKTDAFL